MMTVPLTIALYSGEKALIDASDASLVAGYRWLADHREHTTYAYAHVRVGPGQWQNLKLHRLILGAPAGLEVDHRNRDGLDNRRANLRLATSVENHANTGLRRDNTSGFKGVTRSSKSARWVAQIRRDGRMTYLGAFATPEAAAEAYDAAAVEQWGPHAHLNFPIKSKEWNR